MNTKKKILCIVGPTGSGKTGYSIELAEFLEESFSSSNKKVQIINADSRQVYKDFPVITAQPSVEERKNISHLLYGYLEAHEQSTVGIWLDKVHTEIENAHNSNQLPILVGGTGMYIKALTEGIAQIPKIPEEISKQILDDMSKLGVEKMYEKLQAVDEEYSKKIHKNDRQRIGRALEVYTYTSKAITDWHKSDHAQSKYISKKIGIGMPLDELTPYLAKRIDIMLEQNALEEAKQAFEKFADLSLPAWSGIGCQELGLYLKNEITFDEAKELWIKNTRAYAKRQWTWFRADKSITWVHPFDKTKREELKNSAFDFYK